MSFPKKAFKELFHVGTLIKENKQIGSYEGAGLSVSMHPHEWCKIARIPGKIFSCTKENNSFLNFHKLTKLQKNEISNWGIKNGYLEEKEVFSVTYYDDEWEMELMYEFISQEEAEESAEGYDVPVIMKKKLICTNSLFKRTLNNFHVSSSIDLLSTVFAEEVLLLDGVWWQDKMDVSRLSAPRGVIVPSKVDSWIFVEK